MQYEDTFVDKMVSLLLMLGAAALVTVGVFALAGIMNDESSIGFSVAGTTAPQ